MKKIFCFILVAICFSCNKKEEENYLPMVGYEEGEELSAGKLTTTLLGANAFDQSVPGLALEKDLLFFVGNSLFRQNWVI